jgi:hypothetical protein
MSNSRRFAVRAAAVLFAGWSSLVSLCYAVTIELDTVGPMSPRNQAAWWSPIVNRNGSDYVSYLSSKSPQDDVFVARRAPDGNWETRDTGVNATYDVGHTQTSLAIDGQGYLHVAYGMHNNPMRLVTSNDAESVSGGFSVPAPAAIAAFAGGAYTYPNMTTAPNGDVYMIVRDQRASYANQQGRLFRFDNVNRSWGELPAFAGQSGTTVYPDQILADEAGDLHILWEWAAGGAQAARHYGSYARFDPDTNTYFRADGAAYSAGPINIATADIYQGLEGSETFAANVHGVQSAKLALDSNGKPLIAYGYSTTGADTAYQHRFAHWDGSQWTRSIVTAGPFDIEKPWLAYSDGNLRYYGGVAVADPLYTGTDDIFVRTSTNLGETWSAPIAVTQGRDIQRPVGISLGSMDRLYLPSITAGTLQVADVSWDAPLPGPPPNFPYFNSFSTAGLAHQTAGFELDASNGQLQYSAANGTLVDSATQTISDVETSDFLVSTRLVINSIAGTGNLISIGFGAAASSSGLLSSDGQSFYLADWSVNPHTSQGRLRILAQGDTTDFTAAEGDSDGANPNGSSVALGQEYELQLVGIHTGQALALTLTLFDAAGNQIGTPATAIDASPLAGKYFGLRNRIAGTTHQIDVSFDDFNVHAPLALSGDYNEDGLVDAADYVVWRDNLGGTMALPNDDTAGVDQDDYVRWKANFGQSIGGQAGTAAAVPEPGAGLLLTTYSLVACTRCRQRRRVRTWAA